MLLLSHKEKIFIKHDKYLVLYIFNFVNGEKRDNFKIKKVSDFSDTFLIFYLK